MGNGAADVTVVIPTRNRPDDCRRAIGSVLGQTVAPARLVVYDDASTVDMPAALKEFGDRIELIRFDMQCGATGCRKHSIDHAQTSWLLWLDDDCFLSATTVLEEVMRFADRQESDAAIALPWIEPLRLPQGHAEFVEVVESRPRETIELASYIGGSVLLRRAALRQVGGVREAFLMLGGDEADLATRLVDAGWKISYCDVPPLIHMVSPIRDHRQKFHYDARSRLLCDALNDPFPHVVWSMLRHSIGLFRHKLTLANLPVRLQGVAAGWGAALRHLNQRRAISREAFRKLRRLPKHGVERCPEHLRQAPLDSARDDDRC